MHCKQQEASGGRPPLDGTWPFADLPTLAFPEVRWNETAQSMIRWKNTLDKTLAD